jgi:hypothetical protein
MKTLPALAALALTGCSLQPTVYRAELEHVSHPLAGAPFGPKNEEDSLGQATIVARWESGRAYVEHGLGYNLKGRDGGGFYGPSLTYVGRVGFEFGRAK